MAKDFKSAIRDRMGSFKFPESYIKSQSDSERVSDGSNCVLTAQGRFTATRAGLWMFDIGQQISYSGALPIDGLPDDPKGQRRKAREIGRRILRDAGWDRIGGGTVRDAYVPPDRVVVMDDPEGCVVKVAKWSHRDWDGGVDQIRQEIANWTEAGSVARQRLLPPSEYNEKRMRWITFPEVDTKVPDPQRESVMDELDDSGWTLLDTSPENVGRYRGRLVFLDSGIVWPPNSKEVSEFKNELKAQDPGVTLVPEVFDK